MPSLISDNMPLLSTPNIILLCVALTTALITGLFYAYSVSVNPGLGRLRPENYIAAMQSINRAIQNPLFFISFLGTAILLPVCTYLHFHQPVTTKFYLLLGATLTYLSGGLGVTIFGNVPLNEALDKFDLAASDAPTAAKQKLDFAKQWNKFHTIRTIACFFSLLLVLIACMYRDIK